MLFAVFFLPPGLRLPRMVFFFFFFPARVLSMGNEIAGCATAGGEFGTSADRDLRRSEKLRVRGLRSRAGPGTFIFRFFRSESL